VFGRMVEFLMSWSLSSEEGLKYFLLKNILK
jgi:hypothetical protein